MTKIFLIHGTYGHSQENWFPWLKNELQELDCEVIAPDFPTPQNQSLDNWLAVFDDYKKFVDPKTIFIAHSLGVAFVLNILEKIDVRVKASFLVVGFVSELGNADFDNLNKSFIVKSFNWNIIKNNCSQFFIYHSDNDPYVPLGRAEELAKSLESKVNIISQAGHFNKDSGFIKFPRLLKDIKSIL